MMKSFLATAAVLAAFATGTAFAAEPATATPPAAKGGMFVNAKGMTLYTFDKDTAGKSVCNAQCATNWPPALAADGGRSGGPSGRPHRTPRQRSPPVRPCRTR